MQRADSSIEQLSSKIAAVTEALEAQSQFSKIRNLPDLFSLDSRFSGTGQASRRWGSFLCLNKLHSELFLARVMEGALLGGKS